MLIGYICISTFSFPLFILAFLQYDSAKGAQYVLADSSEASISPANFLKNCFIILAVEANF